MNKFADELQSLTKEAKPNRVKQDKKTAEHYFENELKNKMLNRAKQGYPFLVIPTNKDWSREFVWRLVEMSDEQDIACFSRAKSTIFFWHTVSTCEQDYFEDIL